MKFPIHGLKFFFIDECKLYPVHFGYSWRKIRKKMILNYVVLLNRWRDMKTVDQILILKVEVTWQELDWLLVP